ncbi:histone-lysine N-methyltransferase SETMAR [Elysia marginata]|uniref:Histone-lysine N-methyltransferase SETMAR n=1 Tax=Elysia marginata TaxID=1093978 RepID=A0AAV4JQJ5_9GAST|nr:histone-lysine N-methyltransferase SETMAR [Elysia marginata]
MGNTSTISYRSLCTVSAPLMDVLLNASDSKIATPIKDRSKLEVRPVVRFLLSKGIRLSELTQKIAETYGEGAMSRSRVYQWYTLFREGRASLDDEPKSGRPKTSTNEENTTRVTSSPNVTGR